MLSQGCLAPRHSGSLLLATLGAKESETLLAQEFVYSYEFFALGITPRQQY